MKRMTIRFVPQLAEKIKERAEERGISVNALITEIAWKSVEMWQAKSERKGELKC